MSCCVSCTSQMGIPERSQQFQKDVHRRWGWRQAEIVTPPTKQRRGWSCCAASLWYFGQTWSGFVYNRANCTDWPLPHKRPPFQGQTNNSNSEATKWLSENTVKTQKCSVQPNSEFFHHQKSYSSGTTIQFMFSCLRFPWFLISWLISVSRRAQIAMAWGWFIWSWV